VLLFIGVGASAADVKLLPPEQAFRFAARALDSRTVEARFTVADGYYLYRDKLRFAAEPQAVGLAAPALPPGKVKEDAFFGRVETFRDQVVVRLVLAGAQPGQAVTVRAESQGCADVGVCYPPNTQQVIVTLPAAGSPPGPLIEAHPQKKGWFN